MQIPWDEITIGDLKKMMKKGIKIEINGDKKILHVTKEYPQPQATKNIQKKGIVYFFIRKEDIP